MENCKNEKKVLFCDCTVGDAVILHCKCGKYEIMESFIKVTHASSQTGVKIYEAKKHTETNFLSQASNRSYAEHLYKLSRGGGSVQFT